MHEQVRGVEGPGGAVVVLGKGRVKGGAVEEQVLLGLAGEACSLVGEVVEDLLQDQTVLRDECLGDRTGSGGEGASKGDDDGVGVSGSDPEGTEGGGLWWRISDGASSQAPLARCQTAVVAFGGSRRSVGVEW